MDYSELYFDRQEDFTETFRRLPHRFQNGKLVFITWRQADSMPRELLRDFKAARTLFVSTHPKPWDNKTRTEYNSRFPSWLNRYLDKGHGSCMLRKREARKIVEDAMFYYDDDKIYIHAYVIMPNHVHVLLEMMDAQSAKTIISSIKRFSATKINHLYQLSGEFWMTESYDTLIRSDEHRISVLNYIRNNPRFLHPDSYTIGGRAFIGI